MSVRTLEDVLSSSDDVGKEKKNFEAHRVLSLIDLRGWLCAPHRHQLGDCFHQILENWELVFSPDIVTGCVNHVMYASQAVATASEIWKRA